MSSNSSNHATVVAAGLPLLGSAEHSHSGPCCKVAMCEGSSPHMSKETRSLLRSRLRMSALLLGGGFAVFFLRQLFLVNYHSPEEMFLLLFHGLTSLFLLLIGGRLCQKCTYELSTLRIAELIIFGVPSLYFIAMQWVAIRSGDPFLIGITAPWMLLILTYSLYIPNTWRRAAWVLGLFAVTPTAICIVAAVMLPIYGSMVGPNIISKIFMTMALAAFIGTWGVHTINRLRREAFEAKQLGQYRLKRLLGAGGMGEVHLAEHQLMKRPVAIKLIKPSNAADPTSLARFHREVQATAKLTHLNTIEIFDYGHTDDGTFYYVMEYLPGKSLADLVEQHGPMAPARVVWLLEQICGALAEAHGLGLMHRDIKPGNIFAAERGGVYDVAKLLDFGLAKPLMTGHGDVTLTQQGSITGSPLFMAPEQAAGDGEPDARSDIYALGAVAYYLLTGHPPFEGDNAVKVLLAHANKNVTPPSKLQPGIQSELEQIVLRCLQKKPADRFPDVATLGAELAATPLHGRWTAADAQAWWQTNGGVSRDGMPTVAGAADHTVVGGIQSSTGADPSSGDDSEAGADVASKGSRTRGSSDATQADLAHDSASHSALVG
ncbi:MAG TPA: protein kinase [Pirellulales bacterium]|nr:protein kinase [Pirellulales bacterium]